MGIKDRRSLLPFYIIIIPVALLTVLINSGLLQRTLTVANIGGQKYSCSAYNYYYYTQYHAFIDQNYNNLKTIGYDPSEKADKQQYSESLTWQDHFSLLAEQRMREVAALNAMADAEKYSASGADSETVRKEMAKLQTESKEEGKPDLKDYLVAYYGPGMTTEIYERQFQMETRANSYRTFLEQRQVIAPDNVDKYQAAHDEEYNVSKVRMVSLYPAVDRYTGRTEDRQWVDLSAKMDRLVHRYESGNRTEAAFGELADKYSDRTHSSLSGGLVRVRRGGLESELDSWCFSGKRSHGDILRIKTKTGEHLLYYVGKDKEFAREAAENALRAQRVDKLLAAKLGNYSIEKRPLIMKLAR
jgi:hypothetical protein